MFFSVLLIPGLYLFSFLFFCSVISGISGTSLLLGPTRVYLCIFTEGGGVWGGSLGAGEGVGRGVGGSPAGVHLHHLAALLALDVAAPVELAAAPVHHLHLLGVEAPAAAHELAAVDGLRRLVAVPARRAQHSVFGVVVAEVRAGVQVHQVLVRVRLELGVFGHQDLGGADPPLLHLRGPVELLLDHVPHLPEGGHGLPARLHLARPRHAVTLALHTHVVQDSLGKTHAGSYSTSANRTLETLLRTSINHMFSFVM